MSNKLVKFPARVKIYISSAGLAPSRLLPGGQLFAAQEDFVNLILKSSNCDKDLLWCQIQSHKNNDLDARFIQLVLLALNDDNFVDGVNGFWNGAKNLIFEKKD